jgi:aryl-alcohol dehydrogenase-like predicted oxidoreductase
MNFGPDTAEAESFEIMDRALDAGINFFDTANVYGGKRGEGISEQIIGRWLAGDPNRRHRIVLATKVYGRMGGDRPNENLLSAYHIRRACEESLRRLRTDHIDLYQMHHVDRSTPWEEIWQAMEQLIREGKVLYIGSSNFAAWHIAQANGVAARLGLLGLVSEQSLYNLNARTIELEVLPACAALGLGVLAWSPLAAGLLGGVLDRPQAGRRAAEKITREIEKHRPRIEAYETFCREIGSHPGEVALAWLLRHPIVCPIIGPRTTEQLVDALNALKLELTREQLAKLDAIFPGPGGEAPEAYAW